MYALAIVATGERLDDRTWENGGDAAAAASELNARHADEGSPTRLRVVKLERQISEEDRRAWQNRERVKRSRRGAPPWRFEVFVTSAMQNHFAYVSAEDPTKIAYTPDDEWGVDDRQLRCRPGKYLSEHTDLPDHEISTWVAKWDEQYAPKELHIARTPDECEWVYVNGPNSCMSGDHWCVHPARVYGGPDLAIAYLLQDESGKRASSRCVIWPEEKIHSTIYGDIERMRLALERAGYASGNLDGARVQFIKDGDRIVMPYVDGIYSAERVGKYVELGGGTIFTDSTDGFGYRSNPCGRCGGPTHDEYTLLDNGERWCYSCWENEGIYCEACGNGFAADDTTYGPDARMRCSYCHAEATYDCDECDSTVMHMDSTESPDGHILCDECARHCDECNDAYLIHQLNIDNHCPACAADANAGEPEMKGEAA